MNIKMYNASYVSCPHLELNRYLIQNAYKRNVNFCMNSCCYTHEHIFDTIAIILAPAIVDVFSYVCSLPISCHTNLKLVNMYWVGTKNHGVFQ